MPLTGDTSKECFEKFRGFVADLVVKTLPTKAPVLCPALREDETRRVLTLGSPNQRAVALRSAKHGQVHVSLRQTLHTVAESGRHRLRTQKYNYAFFDREPGPTDEPLFRWEYVADPESDGLWCRSHFHVGVGQVPRPPIDIQIGTAKADLHHLHIPTGFVLLEHVIRFLINDLEVPGIEGWDKELRRCEDRFFAEFNSRTSTP
jgi:hypothetical protein